MWVDGDDGGSVSELYTFKWLTWYNLCYLRACAQLRSCVSLL